MFCSHFNIYIGFMNTQQWSSPEEKVSINRPLLSCCCTDWLRKHTLFLCSSHFSPLGVSAGLDNTQSFSGAQIKPNQLWLCPVWHVFHMFQHTRVLFSEKHKEDLRSDSMKTWLNSVKLFKSPVLTWKDPWTLENESDSIRQNLNI